MKKADKGGVNRYIFKNKAIGGVKALLLSYWHFFTK